MYVSRATRNVELPAAAEVTILSGPTPGEGQVRTVSIEIHNIADATGRLIVTHKRANKIDERIASDPVTAGDFWQLPNKIQLEQGDSLTARVAVAPSKPWQVGVEYEWQDFGAPRLAALFVAANNEFLDHADDAALDMGDIDMSIWGIFRIDDETADAHLFGKWLETGDIREYRLFFKTADKKVYFQVSNDGIAVVEVATTLAVTEGVYFHIYAEHDATGNLLSISLNDATANTQAHTTGINAATATLRLGSDGDGADDLEGAISSVSMWKRVLTALERTWLYNGGAGRDPNDYGLPVTDGAALATSIVDGWPLGEASGDRGSTGSLTLTDNATVLSTAGVPK